MPAIAAAALAFFGVALTFAGTLVTARMKERDKHAMALRELELIEKAREQELPPADIDRLLASVSLRITDATLPSKGLPLEQIMMLIGGFGLMTLFGLAAFDDIGAEAISKSTLLKALNGLTWVAFGLCVAILLSIYTGWATAAIVNLWHRLRR